MLRERESEIEYILYVHLYFSDIEKYIKKKAANYIKCMKHRLGESVGVVLTREIEPIHLLIVPPLMKRNGSLIVFKSLEDRAVYDDLMVL